MNNAPQQFENWRGMVWAGVAALTASAMSIGVRSASFDLDVRLIVFHRFLLGLIILVAVAAVSPKARNSLQFSDPKGHIIRGLLIGFATLGGFYALANIELAAATILFGLAPIFTVIISVFMGQTIGIRRVMAIIAGFVGAIIIIDPRVELELGMLSALFSAFFFGMALAMSRGLAQRDGTFSTLCSAALLTMLVAGIASIPVFAWPSGFTLWFWIWVLVIAGLARQFADIQSYKLAEAAVLAPIFYLRLIFIAIGGYLLFDEVPRLNTWIGAGIVISATLYMTYRERQLEKQKS